MRIFIKNPQFKTCLSHQLLFKKNQCQYEQRKVKRFGTPVILQWAQSALLVGIGIEICQFHPQQPRFYHPRIRAQLLENSQLTLMDEMERLMSNFHYLGYYCSPNLSIHQNSTQELTWNFLVTLDSSQMMSKKSTDELSTTHSGRQFVRACID